MINIGDILRAFGVINGEQLKEAVDRHHREGRRLGETVVDMGLASQEQVDACLTKQAAINANEVRPADAAALADYATERLLEKAGDNVRDITGVYEVQRK